MLYRDRGRIGLDRSLEGDYDAFQATVAWAALRLFGWIAWRGHRRRD